MSNIKTGIFGRPTTKVHLGQAWRIEFSYRKPPELVLLSVPINLEYFYTEIRFSTPGSAPTCQLVYGVDHDSAKAATHAHMHAAPVTSSSS